MPKLNHITVFCGSSKGIDPDIAETTRHLAGILVERDIRIIYGGAKVGLMGILADSALQAGGHVTGVLPGFLQNKEIRHPDLSHMVQTDTMHERKSVMHDLCDGVIALPGGFGTLDELFEMITWSQLGLHGKPIGLLNIKRFWDPLLHMLDKMVDEGFLKEQNRKILLHSNDAELLLDQMEKYQPADVPKWIIKDQL